MKLPAFASPGFRHRLASAGVIVWLATGIAVLAATVQTMLPPEAAAAGSSSLARGGGAAKLARRDSVGAAADSALPRYKSNISLKHGPEIALVFVGASFCGAQNTAGFPQAIEQAKIAVQRRANEGGKQFRAVGVALDWKPADGIAFLARFGEFDEITSGSNWIGDGAMRYVWRDLPTGPGVPQLLIVERSVDASDERSIRVTGDRIVRQVQGTKAIQAWVEAGAPI